MNTINNNIKNLIYLLDDADCQNYIIKELITTGNTVLDTFDELIFASENEKEFQFLTNSKKNIKDALLLQHLYTLFDVDDNKLNINELLIAYNKAIKNNENFEAHLTKYKNTIWYKLNQNDTFIDKIILICNEIGKIEQLSKINLTMMYCTMLSTFDISAIPVFFDEKLLIAIPYSFEDEKENAIVVDINNNHELKKILYQDTYLFHFIEILKKNVIKTYSNNFLLSAYLKSLE